MKMVVYSLIGCFLFMGIGYSALTTTLRFTVRGNKIVPYTFSYTGKEQTFIVEYTGNYQIELWGAQGGGSYQNFDPNYSETGDYHGVGNFVEGGKGSYTSGTIRLTKGERLYVYVGGKGMNGQPKTNATGGYNGGGIGGFGYQGGAAGGGATDIRLTSGSWDDFDGLKSRIMVAAGGSGTSNYNGAVAGGVGGTLNGFSGNLNTNSVTHPLATGGTQTSGGIAGGKAKGTDGAFGIGGNAQLEHGSGGGSGYYGGGGAGFIGAGVSTGAGGSSFISGHSGCNAISSASTSTNIVHTGSPNHYSGKTFTNTKMVAGNSSMPTYDGIGTMIGNNGHGYAKITYLMPS